MDKKKLMMKKYMEETAEEDSSGKSAEDPFYSSAWFGDSKRKQSENLSDSDDASSPVKKKSFEHRPVGQQGANHLVTPKSFDASLSTINDTINAFKAEAETSIHRSVSGGKESEDASSMLHSVASFLCGTVRLQYGTIL